MLEFFSKFVHYMATDSPTGLVYLDLVLYAVILIVVVLFAAAAGLTFLWMVTSPFIWVGEKIHAQRKNKAA